MTFQEDVKWIKIVEQVRYAVQPVYVRKSAKMSSAQLENYVSRAYAKIRVAMPSTVQLELTVKMEIVFQFF